MGIPEENYRSMLQTVKNFNTLGAKGKVNYEMKNVGSLFMNHDLFDEVHESLARDFDELNRKYGNWNVFYIVWKKEKRMIYKNLLWDNCTCRKICIFAFVTEKIFCFRTWLFTYRIFWISDTAKYRRRMYNAMLSYRYFLHAYLVPIYNEKRDYKQGTNKNQNFTF